MIQTIFFDAGGVLFHFKSGLREMATKHNLEYSDFERVFRKYDDQVVKGLMSPQHLWELYQEELNFQEPNIDYLDYWVSRLTPIPETHQFVRELIDDQYPVGLITNLYAGVFEKAVEYGHIPNLSYVCVIQSSIVHMMKPEEEIYLHAQQQAKANPEDILFIDDRQEFLEPASKLGWKTYHFDENDPTASIADIQKIIF